MKFNEKIVKLRKLKGLTQDEFASAVGVSRQAVYKWESGQSYPEVAKLLEIKLLFNVSIDDLLDESYEVTLPEKPKRKRSSYVRKVAEAPAVEAKASELAEEKAEPVAAKAESIAEAARVEEKVAESVEVVKEEVNEEASVATESGAEAPETKETTEGGEKEEEPKPEEAVATQKKRGFFGRLFGRK